MKVFVWSLRAGFKDFVLWFVGGVPLQLGARLRAAVLRHYLGALGRNNVIQQGFRITTPEKVRIGSNCNFGADVVIAGGGGVQIGDWVGFGPDVKVWSVNHCFSDPDVPWQLQGWTARPVVIEDDVWLAANVFVTPGVTIGRGAIISAGTVLAKSVPPFAIVAGNPGRVVGWRKAPASEPLEPLEPLEQAK